MKKIVSLILAIGMTLSLTLPMAAAIDKISSDEISIVGVKVEASSVNENNGKPCEVAENVLDGDTNTIWHSMINPKAEGPHYLTLILPKAEVVTGYRYYPRTNGAAGICTKYVIQVSNDGKKFTTVASGEWGNQSDVKEARFKAVTTKYVKLIMQESNGGFGSAGEVRLIGNSGKSGATATTATAATATSAAATGASASDELSVEGVKVEASSVNENNGKPCEVAENVLDGDTSSIWHSMINPKAEGPHYLTLILPNVEEVSGYRYYPRTEGAAGTCTKYEIQVSTDGKSYKKVASGTWGNQNDVKEAKFTAVKAKYVKLVILEGNGGFGSAGEVRLIGKNGGASTVKNAPVASASTSESTGASVSGSGYTDELPVTGVKMEASSVNENNGKPCEVAEHVLDGDTSSIWHSMINPKAEGPHYLTMILPNVEEVSGYRYYPRTEGAAGTCTKYEIQVSTDGKNYKKVASGTWGNQNDVKEAKFTAVKAKYVKLVILEGNGGFGSAGEVRLIGKNGVASTVKNAQTASASTNTNTSTSTSTNTSASTDTATKTEGSPLKPGQADELSIAGVKVEASSVNENNGKPSEIAEHVLDGDPSSIWHTMINPKAEGPHYLTLILPKEEAIAGYRYYTRTEGSAGICTKYEIQTSKDGKNYTKVASGTWPNNQGVREVRFNTVKAKYVKLVLLESNGGFGSAGDVRLLAPSTETSGYENSPNGKDIKPGELGDEVTPLNWKYESSSVNINNGVPWEQEKNVADGDVSTHWHSLINPKAEAPHFITIILPRTEIISGYRYYPRKGEWTAGICTKYEVWVSADGENYTKEAEGNWKGDSTAKTAYFKENVPAKKVKLVILDGIGGYGSAGEIRVLKKDESKETRGGAVELDETVLQEDENPVTGWKLTASSVNENNGKPAELVEHLIDGNLSSLWHTMINPKAEGPHWVTAVFPEEQYVSGFRYYPRNNGTAGICKEYEIYVSADGVNFTKVSEGKWKYNKDVKEADFFINIKAKAIKFVLTNSEAGFGSGGEIRTLKAKPSYDNVDAATYEKEIEQHKIKPVIFDSMKITTSLDSELSTIPGLISDGETGSLWETTTKDKRYLGPEVDINFEFGYPYTIKGIEYVPRQDGQWHGRGHLKTFEVYTSENGTDYTLFDTITIDNTEDNETKYIFFKQEVNTKYLKFRVLKCRGEYVAIAEIRFLQTEGQNKLEGTLDEETYTLKIGSPDITVRRGTEEKVVTTDALPYIYNGSTMIPLRGLLEEMGAEVSWNGDIQRIDVKSKKGNMVFEIESYMVYIDSIRYTCPVAPQITNSRTYIPLRFISENMGYNVYWNGETQEIRISNK